MAILIVADLVLALAGVYPPSDLAYVGEYENRRSKGFVADPHTGWRMRADGHFRWTQEGQVINYFANASGFRTLGPDAPEATDSDRRIVIVGDSYMWGAGVPYEQTCANLLDDALGDCDVVNLGMPGFGMDQIAMSVRHQALPLEPDLVIVGMYSNDFDRCFTAFRENEGFNKPLFTLDDGALRLQTSDDRPNAIARWIQRRSRLVAVYTRARKPIGHKTGLGFWWALNEAILEMIRTDCRDAGVPVLFVHIPSSKLTTSPALARYMAHTESHYIDLATQPSPPTPDHYFKTHRHFNDIGHKYLVDILTDWIGVNTPELR